MKWSELNSVLNSPVYSERLSQLSKNDTGKAS